MSAVVVAIGAVALAPIAFNLLGLVVVLLLPLLLDRLTMSTWDRMMRERRRHAERTARAMRRMSDIRRQTLVRMDQVEERWRP